MSSFEIIGGKKLKGAITPQGAKNEALQVICAALLTAEPVIIKNIPDILDVNKLLELFTDMGVDIEKLPFKPDKGLNYRTYKIHAKYINHDYLESETFRQQASKFRGSLMILGPLLARFGKSKFPKPGGDKIGRRRLDTHFIGLQKLGVKFNFVRKNNIYQVDASNLQGCYMILDEASVTGTANIVMTASLAKGTTTIYNAACEPYIQQLCKMINNMGGKISGIGSNLLTINGVKTLNGTTHTLLPDMIEIGSFICMAALTSSDITIKNARIDHLGMILNILRKLGIIIHTKGDDIHIPSQEHYEIETFIDGSILTIADAPWPGFTPDLLSTVLVAATQAKGTVMIHQKMFESRLFFVDKLIDMGAQIILCDPHRATVIGLDRQIQLKSISMTSPDIRAGVSLLIAALSADGTSTIHNIEEIDRGYEKIDLRLNKLGAQIKRI